MLSKGKDKWKNNSGYSFDASADMLRKKRSGEVGRIAGDLFDEMFDQDAFQRHYEKNLNKEMKLFWEGLRLDIEGGSIFIMDYGDATDHLSWRMSLIDAVRSSLKHECADSLTETLSELKKCVALIERHLRSQEDAS